MATKQSFTYHMVYILEAEMLLQQDTGDSACDVNELSRMLRAVQSSWYDGLYVQLGWGKDDIWGNVLESGHMKGWEGGGRITYR
jgi:hypothetical protein